MGTGGVSGWGARSRGWTFRGRRPTGGGRGGRWCVALASPLPPLRLPDWLCCTRARGSGRPALRHRHELGGHCWILMVTIVSLDNQLHQRSSWLIEGHHPMQEKQLGTLHPFGSSMKMKPINDDRPS